MKGNSALGQALLAGVQRVAKESIQFNNARVYTVLNRQYSSYFGFTASETEKILADYGLALNQEVQKNMMAIGLERSKCTIRGLF